MSDFSVRVSRIHVRPHPNADRLDIGNIDTPLGWQVVTQKGLYQTGDLVAYAGENSVVPEAVLKHYGFWNEEQNKGLLAGSKGDRVKGVKLRDEFSLGICLRPSKAQDGTISIYVPQTNTYVSVKEGDDVAEILGITKYEPPIPTNLAGEVYNGGTKIGVNYDIEDIRKYPDVLVEGEEVSITEKIHGTNCQLIFLPDSLSTNSSEHLYVKTPNGNTGYIAVASKGLGAQGLFFKHDSPNNANNAYLRVTRQYYDAVVDFLSGIGAPVVTIIGELYGAGIQDLTYDLKNEIKLRVFDIYVGYRGQGRYLNRDELAVTCIRLGMDKVPHLYTGPWKREILDEYTDGANSKFSTIAKCIREGAVVVPVIERIDPVLGRVIVKQRSQAYLSRKGNTTEFN